MAKFLSEPKLVTDNYPSFSFMQELCVHQKWACSAWKAIMRQVSKEQSAVVKQ